MTKIIKKYKDGLKFIIDDHGSGDEHMLLKVEGLVEDYIVPGFGIDKKDTIIDIGAHVGRFSVYTAFHAKDGTVYAFEPDPRNIAKLEENIKINNLHNLHYFDTVVNGTGGSVKFYLSKNSAENSLYESKRVSSSQEVKGITLVDIFKNNNIETCNFLKLDCEGAEYDILFSLPPSYFSKIDKIVLEYHDNLYKEKSLKDLVFLLSKHNFLIHKVKRGAWYLGILYAKRSRTVFLKPLIFLHNYFKVYVFDMLLFCASLVFKKITKK